MKYWSLSSAPLTKAKIALITNNNLSNEMKCLDLKRARLYKIGVFVPQTCL